MIIIHSYEHNSQTFILMSAFKCTLKCLTFCFRKKRLIANSHQFWVLFAEHMFFNGKMLFSLLLYNFFFEIEINM